MKLMSADDYARRETEKKKPQMSIVHLSSSVLMSRLVFFPVIRGAFSICCDGEKH